MKVMRDRLTVALVVGTPLGDGQENLNCGVRDYTERLAQALAESGMDTQVVAPSSWGLHNGFTWIWSLRKTRPDIVHIQYPSIGYRYSLLPHILGLSGAGGTCVVTVHEHSALPRVQRFANTLFRVTADRLVFTTDYEAKAFGASAASAVIPIGSNVPVYNGDTERDQTVLYFGQLRPNKGVEAFIKLARLSLDAGEAWRFVIIGSTPSRWRDYSLSLRVDAPDEVHWIEDARPSEIAKAMATAAAAYLPFPDGAGLRRGTLIAALLSGVPVVAPLGPSTTDELSAVLIPAATPEAALDQLRRLRATPSLGCKHGTMGRIFAQQRDWQMIADRHMSLYRAVLNHAAWRRVA